MVPGACGLSWTSWDDLDSWSCFYISGVSAFTFLKETVWDLVIEEILKCSKKPHQVLQNLLKKSHYLLAFDGIVGLVVVSDRLGWVGAEVGAIASFCSTPGVSAWSPVERRSAKQLLS